MGQERIRTNTIHSYFVSYRAKATLSQITLHLDDSVQALNEQAAQAPGVSKNRWVADLIRKHAAHEWPQDCLDLAGRFADFPLRDEAALPADLPRVGF